MRLVLQCAVCGTVHTVGTPVCSTCRASGIQNLRLLFECMDCFRLGLSPVCEVCAPLLSLDADEGTSDPHDLALEWGVPEEEKSPDPKPLPYETLDDPSDLIGLPTDGSDEAAIDAVDEEFDLSLDETLYPIADDDELRLDEGIDSAAEED